MALTDTQKQIRDECKALGQMLINKNKSYGSSFSDPIHVFSQLPAKEQLFVRIDDKLNRIKRGKEYLDEDTIMDLIGYLVLLRVLRLQEQLQEQALQKAEQELSKATLTSGIIPEGDIKYNIYSDGKTYSGEVLDIKPGDTVTIDFNDIPPPPPPPPTTAPDFSGNGNSSYLAVWDETAGFSTRPKEPNGPWDRRFTDDELEYARRVWIKAPGQKPKKMRKPK